MRNCIILGSGRSGTSMVAGLLASCGYFMGGRLHRPRDANPKGFFEAARINRINDALIRQVVPAQWPLLGRWFQRDRPGRTQMWLARVPVGTQLPAPPALLRRISALVRNPPFCFKDPRFSYTLPVWRPLLGDAAYICVFREPSPTAESMIKEGRDPHHRNMDVDEELAFGVYTLMYEHIVEVHRETGSWLFLHYDQVLRGNGVDRLETFIEAKVNRGFPDASLKRSASDRQAPEAALNVYARLCALAEYNG
ncbi:MAG: hypothetical protein HY763_13385 [Planctomycetes bacterium]|nr:hypothetical protein [Planctomycetota bacterium]